MATEKELLSKLVNATAKVIDRPVTAPTTPADAAAAAVAEEARLAYLRRPAR